jgi:hypothetical protein
MFSQKVGNKLRTYKLFKEVFETEMYLSKNVPSRSFSKFCHNSETPIFLFINSISKSPSTYFVIISVRRHNITSSPVSKNTALLLNT